jgi:hypothetical protein
VDVRLPTTPWAAGFEMSIKGKTRSQATAGGAEAITVCDPVSSSSPCVPGPHETISTSGHACLLTPDIHLSLSFHSVSRLFIA